MGEFALYYYAAAVLGASARVIGEWLAANPRPAFDPGHIWNIAGGVALSAATGMITVPVLTDWRAATLAGLAFGYGGAHATRKAQKSIVAANAAGKEDGG